MALPFSIAPFSTLPSRVKTQLGGIRIFVYAHLSYGLQPRISKAQLWVEKWWTLLAFFSFDKPIAAGAKCWLKTK